jgi:hypothetical protein
MINAAEHTLYHSIEAQGEYMWGFHANIKHHPLCDVIASMNPECLDVEFS